MQLENEFQQCQLQKLTFGPVTIRRVSRQIFVVRFISAAHIGILIRQSSQNYGRGRSRFTTDDQPKARAIRESPTLSVHRDLLLKCLPRPPIRKDVIIATIVAGRTWGALVHD